MPVSERAGGDMVDTGMSLHQSGALSSGMFCVSKCFELGRKKEET